MSRRLLFVGPSLPDAAELLAGTDIQILPPIAAGDLLRLKLERGDIVGIIDGYFHETRAVRHKEIFAALSSGVRVLGASSIGALRAAELERYGMEGIGGIYTDYRNGRLEADDEVALLHGPPETGYKPLSVPLVSMRATLEQAEAHGLVDGIRRHALIRVMGTMPYMQRSYARLVEEACLIGMDPRAARALGHFCKEHARDRKRQDALLLVQSLRAANPTATVLEPPELGRTLFLYAWQLEARGEPRDGGGRRDSDLAALRVCQLFAPDYPAYYRRWVFERLAEECSRDCGDAAVRDSRDTHDSRDTLDAKRCAIAHGVHRGAYERSARTTSFLKHWLTPDELASHLTVDEKLALFLARSFQIAPGIVWDEAVLDSLRGTRPFLRARDLVRAAETVNDDARQRRRGFSLSFLARERVFEWLAARWNTSLDLLELSALDRGLSVDTLVESARPYYLLGKYNPAATELRVVA